MTIYFTSDTHFSHANIIKLCNRPFENVEEMNSTMIRNWNETVLPEDTVYHLGDFAFKGHFEDILSNLNGRKFLIIGNHDSSAVINSEYWEGVSYYKEIVIETTKIVLFHYPIKSWNGMYKNALHFHGHCHGNLEPYGRARDVGVDVWGFKPIKAQEAIFAARDA